MHLRLGIFLISLCIFGVTGCEAPKPMPELQAMEVYVVAKGGEYGDVFAAKGVEVVHEPALVAQFANLTTLYLHPEMLTHPDLELDQFYLDGITISVVDTPMSEVADILPFSRFGFPDLRAETYEDETLVTIAATHSSAEAGQWRFHDFAHKEELGRLIGQIQTNVHTFSK